MGSSMNIRIYPLRALHLLAFILVFLGAILAGCTSVSAVDEGQSPGINLALNPSESELRPILAVPRTDPMGEVTGFLTHNALGSLLFSQHGLTLALLDPLVEDPGVSQIPLQVLQVSYQDSAPGMIPEGGDVRQGVVNRYLGSDPAAWEEGLPIFGSIRYENLYPGIDLVYTGVESWKSGALQLKGTFYIAPGGDPTQIQWTYSGAVEVALTAAGDLEIVVRGSDPEAEPIVLTEYAPVAWQENGPDKIDVPAHFVVDAEGGVGFAVGAYDPERPLIIDPVLEYSTYLGGEAYDEGLDVAVDGARGAVVVGTTMSVEFPSDLPLKEELTGTRNIFLTKFSRDGLEVDFSNFLGGSGSDVGQSIAIDTIGDIYVAGYTLSPDFPATAMNEVPPDGGGENGFVVKFSLSGGTIRYSAVIGGLDDDRFLSVDVDSGGSAYLVGYSASDDFPLSAPIQSRYGGGETDAVYLKLSSVGNEMVISSYLGGSASEEAYGIAVDRDGSPYITGFTTSIDFPTRGPLQDELGGLQDAFLTKVSEDYEAYVYSTYLGIGAASVGNDVVVDRDEHAYLVGTMERSEEEGRGGSDAFVLRLGETGETLDINIVLGGNGDDEGFALGLDRDQNIYVVGFTESDDLNTANSFQPDYGGDGDGFLAQLNPAGELVTYNYIGGSEFDVANGITVFGSGDAMIVGVTFSGDFPTVNPYQRNNRGDGDVFLMKIGEVEFVPTPSPTNTPGPTPLPPTATPEPTVFKSIVDSDTFLYGIFGLIGLVVLLLIIEIIRNARRKR